MLFLWFILLLFVIFYVRYKKEYFDIQKIQINQNKDNIQTIQQKINLLNQNTRRILDKSKYILKHSNTNNKVYQQLTQKYKPYIIQNSPFNYDISKYMKLNTIPKMKNTFNLLDEVNNQQPPLMEQVYPQYVNTKYSHSQLQTHTNTLNNM